MPKLNLARLLDEKRLNEDNYDLIKSLILIRGPLDKVNSGQISELGTYYNLVCGKMAKDTDIANEYSYEKFMTKRNVKVLYALLSYALSRENPGTLEEEKKYLGVMLSRVIITDSQPKSLENDSYIKSVSVQQNLKSKNINELIDLYFSSVVF